MKENGRAFQKMFLPRFPMYLNIWFADEDFPLSARLMIDRCGEHYLTIEDAVSAGEVVLELLKRQICADDSAK